MICKLVVLVSCKSHNKFGGSYEEESNEKETIAIITGY
jgi:hypothetical protein